VHRRVLRPLRSVAAAGVAVVACLALASGTAAAHVTVHPATLPAGASDIELTFRVPDERDNANTVGLQVFFPADLPLLTVDVLPVPGWTATVATRTLATPIQTDDGPVSQVVSDITWTATAGGFGAGQYQDFTIAAAHVPTQPADLVFKSLQTYSNGEVVRWIQVASSSNPNPDSPAPVLTLTAPATEAKPASSGTGLATAALVVSLVALAGVIVLAVVGRRRSSAPAAGPEADAGS